MHRAQRVAANDRRHAQRGFVVVLATAGLWWTAQGLRIVA
jgi:hypothetical protein